MKKLKEELKYSKKGITLISLVVTIIVLLILAGITINMLFGKNGLLNRATDATEEYSRSEAKEKVELLLSEYVIDKASGGIANFLRKNLQVGVAQNEDNTYSFLLGEWQVVTNENEVISIEKFKLDVDKTYPSLASMKADTGLTEGQLVQTEGYWNKQYGGGAYYDIVSSTSLTVNDTKCIQLDNGLYAELHPINDTVTVNQFGAYGDGEHDDAEAIQNALNSKYGNVSFENEEYKLNKEIRIYTGETFINGNNATLYTNDEYNGNPYYAVTINSNSNSGTDINSQMLYNISIQNLKLESREISTKYKIQLRVYNVTNLELEGCSFSIPEIENNKERTITNVWIYTGWHNVTINECNFINHTLASSESGGIWISEMNKQGNSDGLIFTNNYMEKSGHDELIAIWNGEIDNIIIEKNKFYTEEKQVDNPSDVHFRIGVDGNSGNVKKVKFINNIIDTESKGDLFRIESDSSNEENVLIENNTINHTFIKTTDYNRIFATASDETNITIKNNDITIDSVFDELMNFSACKSECIMSNNKIVINGNIIAFIQQNENIKLTNNNIIINGNIQNLIRNVSGLSLISNEITLNGFFNNAILQYNKPITSNIYVYENFFTINDNSKWNTNSRFFLNIYNTNINNNTIELYNNNINAQYQTNTQNLVLLNSIADVDTQKIYLKNNNYGIFKHIAFYNNSILHKIVVDGKEITNTTVLK